MEQKRKSTVLEAWENIISDSDVEIEESSDSSVDFEVEEDEELGEEFHVDPVHDQEEAGPASTDWSQLHTTWVEPLSSSFSDDCSEESEEYLPPPPQLCSSSTNAKKVALTKRRRSNSCRSINKREKGSRQASQTTPPLGDDEDMWHSHGEPDTEPHTPTFSPRHPPGPQVDHTKSWSPLSLFKLFFSMSTLRTIIQNTNKNAERIISAGKKFKWSPLTVKDFYVFLAIVIYAGLVQVPSRADLWRTKWPYNFSFPRQCMTRERFETIFWCLHLSNIREDEENQKKKGTPQYDGLFKIKPLYEEMRIACRSAFHPGREICLDEHMVASKARVGFRQCMKDKPTKFGYKLYVLADSCRGYTWNFFVYEGKTERAQQGSLSMTSVMDLMEFDLLGRGYHLYVDNFYTSPALFNQVRSHQSAACGTIHQSRVGFSKTASNDLPKSAERGDMRWLRKDGLLFVKWKDTKEVTTCSTFHKAYSGATVRRRVKEGDQWCVKDIPVPDPVKDYNKFMGGVDLSDALIQYYTVRGKTMKWYKSFFYHFIDIAVVNSFIILKMLATGRGETPLSQKQFREVLMKELVEESKVALADPTPKPGPSDICMPAYYAESATEKRRKCVFCRQQGRKTKTPIYCTKCDVALCLTSSRNCFQEYHCQL